MHKNWKCNFGQNCNFKILTKMKIAESIVYVISQLIIFEGQGMNSVWRRNIAESIAKTLDTILRKFCEFKILLKPQY